MPKIILIDGNSLLFRAYFAMRDMVTKDGVHTQGVFAFINMLERIIKDNQPDYLAVAFDVKGKTFRHEQYSEYKAGRKKTPIELLQQIPIMHRVLEAMNISVLELESYEADDVIGTVSLRASQEGMDVLVISGDKDELQLIDDNVRVMINKKGVSEFEIYDRALMMERYELTPEQFIDLKGLMGDSSDNIPGIPGIGEKKGVQLLKQYGSVEAVVEHAEEIPGKMGENVRANANLAVMSKELATIYREVPIEYELADLKFASPDYDKLIELYKELEFNSFLNKLKGSQPELPVKGQSEEDFDKRVAAIKNIDFAGFLDEVKPDSKVVIELIGDASHTDQPMVYGVGLLSPSDDVFAFRQLTGFDVEVALERLAERGYSYVGFALKNTVYSMMSYGVNSFRLLHDVEVAEYLIDPNRSKYAIDKMMLRYCNMTWDEAGKNQEQALLRKLLAISIIADKQVGTMESMGLSDLFRDCEMPLIETTASMEMQGIKLDREVLVKTGHEIDVQIARLEEAIYSTAGEKFNINSPKQLGIILFEHLNIPYPNRAKNKSGYSTAADILDKIAEEHPIAADILEYRKYTKLKSTYVDGLLALVASDGKIHPHFNQTVAATGRLSCTEPNLQNIPIRDEYGRLIRKAFVVSESGRTFIGADYSQIELRILAALSGDEILIDAFNSGDDVHKLTASRVLGIPSDKVTARDRARAKVVNFGVVYGMSGFGLSEELSISRKEAQDYIDDYFKKHPTVKEYLDEQIKIAQDDPNHEIRTFFGRVRQIPEYASRRYMDRQLANRLAMNTPIQGTAADIMKFAMNKVYYELKEKGYRSKLVLQVHDELMIETVPGEEEQVKELLKRNMEHAVTFAVALPCEMNFANTWYDLK